MGFFKELFGMEDTYATDRDDVRGWSVNDKQGGTLGRMDDWLYDDDSRAVRYGVVKTDDRRVLIPAGDLRYDDSRRAVIADGYDSARLSSLKPYEGRWDDATERAHYQDYAPDWRENDSLDYGDSRFQGQLPQRLQLIEEQLRVGKRNAQVGEVSIGKRAVTEEVSEDVTLRTERAEITRTPVNRPVEGTAAIGDTETIKVPLYAEEAVIEKKPFITEEIAINKVTDERTETVRDQVRREELVTEGLKDAEFAAAEPSADELARRRTAEEQVDVVPDEFDRPL